MLISSNSLYNKLSLLSGYNPNTFLTYVVLVQLIWAASQVEKNPSREDQVQLCGRESNRNPQINLMEDKDQYQAQLCSVQACS